MSSGRPRRARVLVLATSSRSAEQVRDVSHAHYPRVDYIELLNRIDADVVDYGVYPSGRAGVFLDWLETRLRADPYLALHELARVRRSDRVLCMSERVGIPLAALRRAGAVSTRLAVLFQAWSSRQETAIVRLGLWRTIDVIGVNTSAMRELFISIGVPPERIRLLRWAIDHRFFTPTSRPADSGFILTLGETRLRDYRLLFAAMDGVPLELRVRAGGYASARQKGQQPLDHPLANVSLLPRVSPTGLRDLYAQARFVVLPLHDVIYAAGVTAALEAMCMARAVIATRSRGLADYLVDGETCLLVAPGDVEALRDAIRRLAADRELARRLGENGRSLVERELNQASYVDQLVELLGAASAGRAVGVA